MKCQLLEVEKWIPPTMPIKPFIIDTLSEECYIFIYSGFPKPYSIKQYTELLIGAFKQHAPSVLVNYPPDFNKNDQRDVMAVMATNWVFACSSRNFLDKVTKLNPSNSYFQSVFDFPLDFPGLSSINIYESNLIFLMFFFKRLGSA